MSKNHKIVALNKELKKRGFQDYELFIEEERDTSKEQEIVLL